MDERNYTVYCHTNKINGKKYIGITRQKPYARYGKNGSGYRNCSCFYNAIKYYGWDCFEHTVLLQNLTYEEAEIQEIHLISALNTIRPNGYNLDSGGNAKRVHTEETKRKISESEKGRVGSFTGRHHTAESKKSISDANKGKPKYALRGKHRSDETKQKISAKTIGHKGYLICHSEESKRKIALSKEVKVVCVETGIIYDSSLKAANSVGVSASCICCALQGKQKTSGGYHWKYYEEKVNVSADNESVGPLPER